ncbi:oligopeptide transporter 7 [Cryptomeria japonica]|uniref:oligopeptide transporter 7 n=1 Tax=Cryptomeria japonica TaxID=3369 RepID=UPI0025AC2C28|nr:oligopeptide transporter 7 [Cryptomeria japonica]
MEVLSGSEDMEDSCGSSSLTPLLEHDTENLGSNREGNTENESDNEEKEDPNGCYTEEIANEEDVSPIEQVALTVPTTDDPSLPVLTFRMWVLGLLSCAGLSFLNQFFSYRVEPLTITSVSAQIAVLPLGRFMAATLPETKFKVPGTKWKFCLNPGPFNVKEHVLITIFAGAGASPINAIHIVNIIKIFYKRNLDLYVALLIVLMSQVLGFGWAGIFRKHLVEPSTMWWPANLVQVSLFRTLHEKEERQRGGVTRIQFFLIALTCSFGYYLLPGYLSPLLTSFSWLCWMFPRSVIAQQVGSGLHGLGLGAVGLDWSTICSYLGSPLATPWFAVANVGVGFVLIMYVITPLTYWFGVYDARVFPMFSKDLFTSTGQIYNISSIVDSDLHLDEKAYEKYGQLHLSTFFVFSYSIAFAALSATVMHAVIFHGKDIWNLRIHTFKDRKMDVHSRLMRKYKAVPEWWFFIFLALTLTVTITVCEWFKDQLQLRWWGVLLSCGLAIFFTLPIGIIKATTDKSLGLNVISEYIFGYISPGRPVANICFKILSDITISQALTFLQDFKLGQYMKIPPRSMFMAQMIGTSVAALVYIGTAWWMIDNIPNLCNTAALPDNSPWVCPVDQVIYDASVIWGLIGPRRIFGSLGPYGAVNWSFLIGAIAPILAWLLQKMWPEKTWIKYINMPVLIGATSLMPPATAVNFTSWLIIGFIFSFVIYRYHKQWWQKHNYVLSAGLDAGLAFMGVLLYVCLGLENVSLEWWGTNLDGCPLASCPTAKNVSVENCPIFV